jgi:hypothetical protein
MPPPAWGSGRASVPPGGGGGVLLFESLATPVWSTSCGAFVFALQWTRVRCVTVDMVRTSFNGVFQRVSQSLRCAGRRGVQRKSFVDIAVLSAGCCSRYVASLKGEC